MAEYAVELRNVSKRFPAPSGEIVAAVRNITMQIHDGEFFSMLGPSGCGKTTSLRMIAGFELPTEGEVYIHGQSMGQKPPFQRPVNTVFQNYALFPHMTIGDNVGFGLEMKKVSKDEILRRVTEALEMVRLPGFEKRRTRQMSGGQQQRVALARALVNRPEVLLLDEPLGALDLKLRKQMQLELKRIQTEVGITFIYVTHDQEEAMTMSDRIAVMRAGRIEQLGNPEELYERPRTAFVAGFLGVSNLLEGEVAGRDGSLVTVRLPDGTLLRAPADGVASSGGVRIGVRPEKLRVDPRAEGGATDGLNALSGTVLDASYIGVSTQYVVQTAEGHRLTVYAQNLDTAGAAELLANGQRVLLTWKPQHTFVISGPVEHVAGDPHGSGEGETDE